MTTKSTRWTWRELRWWLYWTTDSNTIRRGTGSLQGWLCWLRRRTKLALIRWLMGAPPETGALKVFILREDGEYSTAYVCDPTAPVGVVGYWPREVRRSA